MEVLFKNRDGETFSFVKNDKHIQWGGKFDHIRMSYKNDYSKAYNAYIESWDSESNEDVLTLEEFESKIFEHAPLREKFASLIKPTKEISSIDPSGGPYINIGKNMGDIHSDFEGQIVSEIEPMREKYLLKIK